MPEGIPLCESRRPSALVESSSRKRRTYPMSRPPYRGLSIALRAVSVLIAVGGLFMIFSSRPLILRVFMHPAESEVSTLLLALLKEMGGMMLMLSVMLFLAARDPARNVAILDALIVGLCILAITPLLSLKM